MIINSEAFAFGIVLIYRNSLVARLFKPNRAAWDILPDLATFLCSLRVLIAFCTPLWAIIRKLQKVCSYDDSFGVINC